MNVPTSTWGERQASCMRVSKENVMLHAECCYFAYIDFYRHFLSFLTSVLCALKYFTKGFPVNSPWLLEFLWFYFLCHIRFGRMVWSFFLVISFSSSSWSLQTQEGHLVFKIRSFHLPHLEANLQRQGNSTTQRILQLPNSHFPS